MILYVGDNSDIPSELLKQFYHAFQQRVGVDLAYSYNEIQRDAVFLIFI
jgi:hypothetical protein